MLCSSLLFWKVDPEHSKLKDLRTQAVREKVRMSEVWGVGIGECVVWTQAVRQKGGMSEVWSVGRW